MTGWSVGVDVGGTFTDLVAVSGEGNVETVKVLSTPADQSLGVDDALERLGRRDIDRLVHGTTVATNALLERSGARVAFCTTAGFTDILELRRQNRASLYDLSVHHPAPLAPRELAIGVVERVSVGGVIVELTDAEAERVAIHATTLGVDAVAICLLHAYRDPSHEQKLRDAFRRVAPDIDVVLSSDVFPEIREFERASTTVAEAYLRPRTATYLDSLDMRVSARGISELAVMTSSGGMLSARDARSSAARLALSGPAGGVVGAAAFLRAAGIGKALTIDIGGTSADVGLIVDGEALVEPGGEIAGVPISLPRVLVETVSAGGGSIAWKDAGGALRVGPRSAGAVPGPAAFARGGTLPTVTDAHVALGRFDGVALSGGVVLDAHAALDALQPLATALSTDIPRLARAIIATADATMARALRTLSVNRGIDPRECVLVGFGGGGPLHACGLAERVGIDEIIIPPYSGLLSALGLALAPERIERMVSVMRPLSQLVMGGPVGPMPMAGGYSRTSLRARYVGQGHEIDVPAPIGATPASIAASFSAIHAQRVGYALDRAIEVVSARTTVVRDGREMEFARHGDASLATPGMTDRNAPLSGSIRGESSIALDGATMHVAAGWVATPLAVGGWRLTRQ